MKLSILGVLIGMVAAEECDASQMSFEFYDDDKCIKMNGQLTEDYGFPKDQTNFEAKCQVDDKYSYKIACSKDGMHQDIWAGNKCEGETFAKFDMGWNECHRLVGTHTVWFKAQTDQTFA